LGLSRIDKIRIWKNLFTRTTWKSIVEIVREGLLHRNIFRQNKVLGYMHASLAFGWFLLIVVGHVETFFFKQSPLFPTYFPIFFNYFVTDNHPFFLSEILKFTMDLLLFAVLSGVGLAYYKRINKRIFGLKRATKLKWGDRVAMISLWLIFPLRFFAETFTAGVYHNGSVLIQPFGNLFAHIHALPMLIYPVWTAYSFALGFFFVTLPLSRYMHIPTEILLIFLRNSGVKLKKRADTYSLVQVYSCSRCGICIDSCQMNDAEIRNSQSVYVLKNIRNENLSDETLFNCLFCGKCQNVCPVGIETVDLRITQRIESTLQYNSAYDYLKETRARKAEVIYFAGCMTHLTPAIKKSMLKIFETAKIDYWFMDQDKAPCCGRPLMQAGQYDAAEKLIANNRQQILDSGAKTLVVSCPICYKVFNEDYALPGITVKHHSEYILELTQTGKIPILKTNKKIVYHDPCELGRGSEIYDQPRELLSQFADLIPIKNEKENSLCCGGSLANIKISMSERTQISDKVLEEFQKYQPDFIVTACPLCKKTFSKGRNLKVLDIAEIAAAGLKETDCEQKNFNPKHENSATKKLNIV
jgi:Fe-S oxidoreductase